MNTRSLLCVALLCVVLAAALPAQNPSSTAKTPATPAPKTPAPKPPAPAGPKPLGVQSTSSYTQTEKNGQTTVDIHNVSYYMSGQGVPGLPIEQRLLLRKSTRERQALDEIGGLATVTLEAWTLGVDPKQKPLYSATITGNDAEIVENAVWVVSRGIEDVQWWSVLKLGTAQRLFDTYVPLLHFSISRETLTERYIGLDIPPDDARDARLKEPHVVAVLEYASDDRVIREALLTCDDPQRARLLRSYEDGARTLTGTPQGLTISFSQNFPSPPDTIAFTVPLLLSPSNDDLDLAKAKLPAGLHIAAWKR
jgi:hypothetical protein